MSRLLNLILFLSLAFSSLGQTTKTNISSDYLSNVQKELKIVFPKNKIINLVFHGHSVPSGYWSHQEVHTLESYPNLLLRKLKSIYSYAVINIIITSIGGESSEKGQSRLKTDVLPHKPDVLFIDYALNDLGIGLERSKVAWEKMIEEALANNIKVVLVTPSPDQRHNILEPGNNLELHAKQIRELANQYKIGLADPFTGFQKIAVKEGSIEAYMSHVNHPNEKGHNLIAEEIFKLFK